MSGKRPNSRRNLDLAIMRKFGQGEEYMRIRTVMANVVVGQMMPSGAVKGGSAIKIRLGEATTRFTSDFDVARGDELEAFVASFDAALKAGWNGFSGTVAYKEPASPEGVPAEYVMQPYDIKLSYNGKPWCTVSLEIGHNEIGDADNPEWAISPEIVEIFRDMGFPDPTPIPLMPLNHQVAQKLHGLSEEGSTRAHDLVDLQLIMADGSVDLTQTLNICKRLFAYRNKQSWPCTIAVGDGWSELYAEARVGLDVIDDVEDAVKWANKLIGKIAVAK